MTVSTTVDAGVWLGKYLDDIDTDVALAPTASFFQITTRMTS